jgi:hypothetical protein
VGNESLSHVLLYNLLLSEVRTVITYYGNLLLSDGDNLTYSRLEVYCGKKAHLGGPQTVDDKSGPAAVLRNLAHVIPTDRTAYHLVATDRYYTSVALALELLAMRVYTVGTVQPRRIGFPASIRETRSSRPSDIPRGSYKVARCRTVPNLIATCWWDSKPVHFIATGASSQELTTGNVLFGLILQRKIDNFDYRSAKFVARRR